MPNWCVNVLTLRHDDPAMITKAAKASQEDNLFQEFVPVKDDESKTSAWGTKWDVSDATISIQESNMIKIYFMTAWSPPVGFYGAMNELGFDVYALWNEPGMGLLGIYDNGGMDEFEYPISPEDYEALPTVFEDEFQIETDFYEHQIDDYAQNL